MTQAKEEKLNEEEIKEKFTEFRMLQQQIEQINEHLEQLNQQNIELEISINAVRELEKTPLHNEILAPIASGIFFKAELKDNIKLVVNVGSDVTVERTIPEVVALLLLQQRELTQKISEASAMLQDLFDQYRRQWQNASFSPCARARGDLYG